MPCALQTRPRPLRHRTVTGHPFAGRRTTVLSMEEVRQLLPMEVAVDIQRDAFIALAEDRTTEAPNSWLRLPGERRGWLKLLAGHDSASDGLAVKVLARFPQNPPGANLGSLILLFDPLNGFPLAILDGVYITAVRTGAGAALATDLLAKPDASTVGLLGTGVVAWYSMLGIRGVRSDIRALRVYSRSRERRDAFAERARSELGYEVTPVEEVDAAVEDADIIVTATNSPEPVLLERHLQPGCHVNAMGIRTEIDPSTIARCLVIPDGHEEAINDGKFSVAIAAGAVTNNDIGPTLGDLLKDPATRPASGAVTLFDSSGVAVQDVTCARYAWEKAVEAGVGTSVDMGLDRSP